MHWARRIRTMLLLLLLGLAMTVAIGWCCAWFVPPEHVRATGRLSDDGKGVCWTRESLGVEQTAFWPAVPAEFSTDPIDVYRRGVRAYDVSQWSMEGSAGWPLPALRWRCELGWSAVATSPPATNNFGLPPLFITTLPAPVITSVSHGWAPAGAVKLDSFGSLVLHLLPCEPIWRGLAANTAFCGASMWLAGWIAAVLRRGRRMRRGLCMLCGYDLRGLWERRCPECGVPADDRHLHGQRARAVVARGVLLLTGAAASTLAAAWIPASVINLDPAHVRMAWLAAAPDPWLMRQYDALASTRVVWLYSDAIVHERESFERARSRLEDRLSEGETETSAARVEAIIAARQRQLSERRKAIGNTDPDAAPYWDQRPREPVMSFGSERAVVHDARGWPLRSLSMQFLANAQVGLDMRMVDSARGEQFEHCLTLAPSSAPSLLSAKALPLHILWSGFVVDSALFGLAYLLIASAFNRLCRARSTPLPLRASPGAPGSPESRSPPPPPPSPRAESGGDCS